MRTNRFILSAIILLATFGAVVVSSGSARAEADYVVYDRGGNPRLKSAGELGLFFGFVPGAAGELANPGLQLTPGLSLAAGNKVRYHLTFAYSRLGGGHRNSDPLNGIDVRPLTLGFPIHIVSGDEVGFAIEPLVDLIGVQAYFGSYSKVYLLLSGFGVQGVLNFKSIYLSFSPVNFQIQYVNVGSGVGGFGLNTPVRFSVGMRF